MYGLPEVCPSFSALNKAKLSLIMYNDSNRGLLSRAVTAVESNFGLGHSEFWTDEEPLA